MKNKNKIKWMIAGLLLPIFLFTSGYLLQFKELVEPDNPLLEKAYAQDMYVESAGAISIEEDEVGFEQDIPLTKAQIKDEEPVKDQEEEPNLPEDSIKDETKDEESEADQGDIGSLNNDKNQKDKIDGNDQIEAFEENELLSSGESKPGKSPKPSPSSPNAQGGSSQNPTSGETKNEEGETGQVGEGEELDPGLPGDQEVSYGEDTSEEYFKTSITSGETVNERDYSFTITHLKKELNVVKQEIYVNNVIFPQFKGRVLLQGGKNEIKVSVTYRLKDGRIRAYFRVYEVNVDLGDITIDTDLRDQTVTEESYTFTANADLLGKKANLEVKHNGNRVNESSPGTYTLSLQEGINKITLVGKSQGLSESKTYTITYEKSKELEISTDLINQSTQEESFTFKAILKNGANKIRFTVHFNDQMIYPTGDQYEVTLKNGSNKIRIRGIDEKDGENRDVRANYLINYVPKATEETKPVISEINVSEGMVIKGDRFTLNIKAKDYEGNNIFAENILVLLNGTVIKTKDTNQYFTSNITLNSGNNQIQVKITDKNGRENQYSYNVYCETVKDGDSVGKMSITVDAKVLGLGIIAKKVDVDVIQGEIASRAVSRILGELGFTVGHGGSLDSGFYLSRLDKPGIGANVSIPEELVDFINRDGLEWKDQRYQNSLGEFDYTQGSGWMYKQNGVFPTKGLSEVVFKDGDVLEIRYTLAYGKDIGGFQSGGSNYDKTW